MKTMSSFVLFCAMLCITANFAKAAPVSYAEPNRVRFTAKSGDWRNAKNWSNEKVPSGFTTAYIPAGKEAFLKGKAEITCNLNLGGGGAAPGVLTLEKGAKMSVGFLGVLGTAPNANGILNLKGGELTVGNDKDNQGLLYVGTATSHSGKGLFVFSDGVFKGGAVVGADVVNTQTGVLRVEGTKAKIEAGDSKRNFLKLNPYGTIEFVLDKNGVSTLDYRDAHYFDEGGKIVVDGQAYEGPSKNIPLIAAFKMHLKGNPQVEVVRFAPRYTAEVVAEYKNGAESLVLKIVQK